MTSSPLLLPLFLAGGILPLLADKTPENDPDVIFATSLRAPNFDG